MNEELKQILKNQATILRALSDVNGLDNEALVSIDYRMDETKKLLHPEIKPTIADRTHDALVSQNAKLWRIE